MYFQILVKRCHECRDLLDEAKKFHLRPELRYQMSGPRMKARCGTDDLLVVVGGFGAHQNMVEVVEQYDPKTEEWTSLPVSGLDLFIRLYFVTFCQHYFSCIIRNLRIKL